MRKQHMSVARVERLNASKIVAVERHNERKNDTYTNLNVVPERIPENVHFKSTGDLTYGAYFQRLVDDGKISMRGLKKDATLYNEIIIDVNTQYFEDHGGYEYAKAFYAEAYRFCCGLYDEDMILSAVMHADELNYALTDLAGRPVYHYHLHVVAIPTVEKEIRWSKRCKDPALVGTVKEVIRQVSHSKKWKNTEQAKDNDGNPVFDKLGRPILEKSYSVLQDQLFAHMQKAGFRDFVRGTKSSNAAHLSSLEYQIRKDTERLEEIRHSVEAMDEILEDRQYALQDTEQQLTQSKEALDKTKRALSDKKIEYKSYTTIQKTMDEIPTMGKKTMTGKYAMSETDYKELTALAEEGLTSRRQIRRLEEDVKDYRDSARYWSRKSSEAEQQVSYLTEKLQKLQADFDRLAELTRPYLEALRHFPEKVKAFLDDLLAPLRKQQEVTRQQAEMPHPQRKRRGEWER